jgi:hypothetical protein
MTEQEIKIVVFATSMSDLLYDIRTESEIIYEMSTPNSDDEVPKEFIDKIIDDEEHAIKMKFLIKNAIIKWLTRYPEDYKNDKDEYNYTVDVYDHSHAIDEYVERLYEDTNCTKSVWVCPDCRSDNVQFKTWTNANTMKASNEECPMEDGDCACNDCESTSILEIVTMIPRRKLIGFQVNIIDGVGHKEMHPHTETKSSVYNLDQAKSMMDDDNLGSEYNELKAIWTDDLECPEIMFEGDIR